MVHISYIRGRLHGQLLPCAFITHSTGDEIAAGCQKLRLLTAS